MYAVIVTGGKQYKVAEGETLRVENLAAEEGAEAVVISARIEEEVAALDDAAEKVEFLETLGLKETGLARVIRAGYHLLDLITYFTAGPKEARAWTISRGTKAPQAAGVIHGDFERGFIRADVAEFDMFAEHGSWGNLKAVGLLRSEGREYVVQDGDVIYFRFNV